MRMARVWSSIHKLVRSSSSALIYSSRDDGSRSRTKPEPSYEEPTSPVMLVKRLFCCSLLHTKPVQFVCSVAFLPKLSVDFAAALYLAKQDSTNLRLRVRPSLVTPDWRTAGERSHVRSGCTRSCRRRMRPTIRLYVIT